MLENGPAQSISLRRARPTADIAQQELHHRPMGWDVLRNPRNSESSPGGKTGAKGPVRDRRVWGRESGEDTFRKVFVSRRARQMRDTILRRL